MNPQTPRSVAIVQGSAERDGSTVSGLTVVKAVQSHGAEPVVIFGSEGPMQSEYAAAGCKLCTVSHGQWLQGGGGWRGVRRLYRDYLASRRLAQVLRVVRPDLVYVNSLVGWAGASAGHRLSIPVIWHLRELFSDAGGEMHPPGVGGKRFVRSQIRRLSTAVVAVSNVVAEQFVGLGDPKVSVIPNVVEPGFAATEGQTMEIREKFGFRAEDYVVGAIGSIRPVKGFDILVSSLSEIQRAIPGAVVAIAGAGDHSGLLRIAEASGTSGSLRCLGQVNPISAFYQACDVICVPSRSESFGRVAVEAMSSGVPVVATAVGGMQENIEHERTGLLVEPGQPHDLAAAIIRLHRDPKMAGSLVTKGMEEVSTHFRPEVVTRKLTRLIGEVMVGSFARAEPAHVIV